MQRLNESELMINPENVKAFLNGDKSYGITGFLELYEKYVNINSGKIIDLGVIKIFLMLKTKQTV